MHGSEVYIILIIASSMSAASLEQSMMIAGSAKAASREQFIAAYTGGKRERGKRCWKN
jgi:hypothetical protein